MADILPGHLYWPMTEVHLYNHGVIQSEQGELVQVLVGWDGTSQLSRVGSSPSGASTRESEWSEMAPWY